MPDKNKMQFPKPTISASSVSLYKSCPRGWYLVNVMGYKPPVGPALTQGTMWDCMFKAYHSGKDPLEVAKKECLSKPPTKDQLKDFKLFTEILDEYKKDPCEFVNPKFDVKFKVYLEHPKTKEVLEYPLFGYLDGLDQTPFETRGIEVKTTSYDCAHEWGWNQKKVDSEIQADIYAYNLHKNEAQINPEIDYIVFNKNTKKVTRLTTRKTEEDFIALFNTIKLFIDNVRAEKFDMNPNHPRFCPCIPYDKGL